MKHFYFVMYIANERFRGPENINSVTLTYKNVLYIPYVSSKQVKAYVGSTEGRELHD
jgi:hypothetical protein